MKVVARFRVQSFFDINGMDTLSTHFMPTVIIASGAEYCSYDVACKYFEKSYFRVFLNDFKNYIERCVTFTNI